MRQVITLAAFIVIGLLFGECQAGEFRLLKVNKLHLESARYFGTNRHWSAQKEEPRRGTLSLKLDFSNHSETLFFRTIVDSHYTTSQFRYVALTEEIAVEPWQQGIELFINHKSEHALDYNYGVEYPNTNTFGVRIKFID